jgi:hypothetical protein
MECVIGLVIFMIYLQFYGTQFAQLICDGILFVGMQFTGVLLLWMAG